MDDYNDSRVLILVSNGETHPTNMVYEVPNGQSNLFYK